jgi:phenylalanyl-tRNA synthetase beta chain
MPVVGIDISQLKKLINTDIENKKLVKLLEELGCDVEGFAVLKRFKCSNCSGITEITEGEERPAYCSVCGLDFREMPERITETDPLHVLRMELLAVRPDIFDAGGLSRAVKGYTGLETGLRIYTLGKQTEIINVHDSIRTIRPFIVGAIIRDIKMTDDFIKTLMKLQENLHWALGRNRRHASIGVYDYDKVKGDFTYTAKNPDFRFIPLGYELKEDNRVSLADILYKHPKGEHYAFLLEEYKQYPILMDSNNLVLSMPPIINSEDTKVTKDTKNLIIDVTGPIERLINITLNIIVTSILEYQEKAVCERIKIIYSDREVVTPDFSIETMDLSVQDTVKLLGIDLEIKQMCELIRKMRHDAEIIDNDTIRCSIPPYRNDILHPRDLMEDAAIAYGYHNIKPSLIETMTVGQEREVEILCNKARDILSGHGFMEITTLMLTNEEDHFQRLGLQHNPAAVEIENPISIEQTIMRTHLISGLMEAFKQNIHNDLPQKLFEVSDITLIRESETGAVDEKHAAAGIIGAGASFSEIKSYLISFMHEINEQWTLKESDARLFIPGRGAVILVDGKEAGLFGEVHPEILENYHLLYPVALFEVKI